jgi:hypothetical protein
MNGEIDISFFHEKKGQGARSNTHRAPLLHFFILHLSLKREATKGAREMN